MNEPNQNIASYLSLDVEMISEANEEIRSHLRQMILGTPGKLQYRFQDIDEKLSNLKNCRFLILKKSGRMLGCVCLIRRESKVERGDYSFWYIRYAFMRLPLKPKNYREGKKKREETTQMNYLWNSIIKYFEQPEIMINESDQKKQSLLYGYVPKMHIRSANFSSHFGLVPVRTFTTCFFSRLNPKKNMYVRQFREEEKDNIIKLLREFYKDHVLYFEQNLFYKEQYYVYVKDNEIMAGIQANPEAWEFLNKPGLSGFILLKVLPVIPFFSKYWKPQDFKFTAVEGIFYKNGHEDKLIPLMESVCAIHETHYIFYWSDTGSNIYKIIRKPGVKGFLSIFFPSEEVDIRTRFINWQKEEIDDFIRRPAYISCFDST